MIITCILCLSTVDAAAQMFSVRENSEERRDLPRNALYLGLEPASFDFRGNPEFPGINPEDTNDLVDFYEFDGSIIRLRYESGGIELYLGAAGGLTGVDEVSYFDGGVTFTQELPLILNQKFRLWLPVRLKGTLTSVESNITLSPVSALATVPQFDQGSLGIGAGGSFEIRLNEDLRFAGRAVPGIGVTISSGNTFAGRVLDLDAGARFYIDRMVDRFGLSLGWDYRIRDFNVDGELFDYNLRTNSFLIGVTF